MRQTYMRRGYRVSHFLEPLVGIRVLKDVDGEPFFASFTYDGMSAGALVNRITDAKWKRHHFCFRCCVVTKHIECGNCGRFFCLSCADWEEEYEDRARYPVHRMCLE